MRGEDRSISETMTLPGPPLGWSEGVGGGIKEAGDDGSGAANSDDVSMSSCLDAFDEALDDLPDLLAGLDMILFLMSLCKDTK